MLRKLCSFLLILFVLPQLAAAQQHTEYPDDYLSPAFHAGRRAAVRELMPQKTVAVFFAAQTRNRSNDVDFIYAQNKNFYYLTGLTEPNAMLLLFKEPATINGETGTEFIFVQPRNPAREMWTGKILGVDGVKKKHQLEHVFTHEQFNYNTIDFSRTDSVMTNLYNEKILSKYYNGRGGVDPLSRM
ncbi:MAG: aminopeptidase P N-terminal domain-containing protein, partial [Bacteroidetes bacterium]|nr:aminopeptidase P N-terminal domain-containing protein [Bacteroidota bacterium]